MPPRSLPQPSSLTHAAALDAPLRARHVGRRRRALWVLAAVSTSGAQTAGCYAYAPIESAAAPPAPDRELRVELTAVAAEALAPRVGPDVRAVDGRVRSRDGDALALAVTRTVLRSGLEQEWRGEVVAIPMSGVAQLKERRLSRGRTALLGAVIVGGAALAAVAAGSGFSISGSGRGGTGQER